MRKHQKVGGEYANVSCWRQTGIGFKHKMNRFDVSDVTLLYLIPEFLN